MEFSLSKKDYAYNTIRNRILSGEYSYLYKLPPEPELAELLKISRGTLRPALKKLESEGYVAGIKKNGTFVTYRKGNTRKKIVFLLESDARIESPGNYILPGIKARAAELGYELVFCETEFFFSNSMLDKLKGCVGVFLSPFTMFFTEEVVKFLDNINIPIVFNMNPGAYPGRKMCLYVKTDYKAAWSEAVRYLAAKGNSRVALILAPDFSERGVSSLKEHLEIMDFAGVAPDKKLIKTITYEKKLIKKAVKEIITSSGTPPDAFMCFSDFYAIHVYEALQEAGLRIPEDISVMGFCGYPGGAFLTPSLTTVDMNYFEKGAAMVDILHDKLTANPLDEDFIVVRHQIVERESVCLKKSFADKKEPVA